MNHHKIISTGKPRPTLNAIQDLYLTLWEIMGSLIKDPTNPNAAALFLADQLASAYHDQLALNEHTIHTYKIPSDIVVVLRSLTTQYDLIESIMYLKRAIPTKDIPRYLQTIEFLTVNFYTQNPAHI